ncbi:hypothetical protein [Telmatospirillum sp. J64-1]|uniref:hypothetical protein n=1 Tax=Telmatospirillum sp. J64-1 TaxID=2502183 RepID=UPI00115E10DB|nr:hypothetical protein [Telmatospirillum sp. J64-1]
MRIAPFAVLAAAALLSACGTSQRAEAPPCPPVSVLADASEMTRFRPGPGRDITDVELEAEITGFRGSCVYRGNTAHMTLAVAIEVKRGPAAQGREADLPFFLAIPAFYPADEAKAVLPVRIAFPPNVEAVRYVEENIELTVPMKEGEALETYRIYLGLQLDEAQLEYNRQQR